MMTVVVERISESTARRLRIDLLAHSADPRTGRCRRCGVRECPAYRCARTELVLAGRVPMPGLACTTSGRGCTGHDYVSRRTS